MHYPWTSCFGGHYLSSTISYGWCISEYYENKVQFKEKIFTMIAYLPKATVQAAIGGLALEAGLASGELILTAAVTAILVTAPLGAIFISLTYRNFLQKA